MVLKQTMHAKGVHSIVFSDFLVCIAYKLVSILCMHLMDQGCPHLEILTLYLPVLCLHFLFFHP